MEHMEMTIDFTTREGRRAQGRLIQQAAEEAGLSLEAMRVLESELLHASGWEPTWDEWDGFLHERQMSYGKLTVREWLDRLDRKAAEEKDRRELAVAAREGAR